MQHYGSLSAGSGSRRARSSSIPARPYIVAIGQINLDGATIAGSLICDRSTLIFKQHPDDIEFPGNPREVFRAVHLDVRGIVSFSEVFVEGGVCLYQAKIGGNLNCDGSRFSNRGNTALLLTGIKIGGAVFLARRFLAIGQVNLEFSEIGGSLNCEGGLIVNCPPARVASDQPPALNLESARVKGAVYLKRWCVVIGRVHLHSTEIGGHLDCSGGRFINIGACAILANHARILNGVLLRDGFEARGDVRLFAAFVAGNLECTRGTFSYESGNALDVERAHVIGHIFLNGGFNSEGTVNLCATTIDGNVICDRGHFASAAATAVQMERMDVTGHLSLSDGFRAEGTVSLLRARIGGNLGCLGGQFSAPERSPSADVPRYALQAESSTIGGSACLS